MIERPIGFTSMMVRALREGRMTRTRRLVSEEPGVYARTAAKVRDSWEFRNGNGQRIQIVRCPFGAIGDRLWVREAWAVRDGETIFAADCDDAANVAWSQGSHLPRSKARLRLELISIDIDRLHTTTEREARESGAEDLDEFELMWQEMYYRRSPWAQNPWTWKLEFRKVSL